MARPKSLRIGRKMQAVVYYVRNHPGRPMLAATEFVGPYGSRCYGYRTVHRAIAAGLVRGERQSNGTVLLYLV